MKPSANKHVCSSVCVCMYVCIFFSTAQICFDFILCSASLNVWRLRNLHGIFWNKVRMLPEHHFCYILFYIPHCVSRTELRSFLGIQLLIVVSFPAATDRIRVSSIRVSSSRQWWISGRGSTSKRPQHAVWDMNAICKSINMLMILLTVTSLIILLLH